MLRGRIAAIAMVVLLAGSAAAADLVTGLIRLEQGDYAGAMRELQPLAEQGDASAQYVVGVMLLSGLASETESGQAADWIRRAAENGHVEAQVELARMYRVGDRVPPDEGRMVEWYRRAAEQGHVGAQLFVADAYAYGHGVPADNVQAYMWYEVAMRYWGDLAQHARDVVEERMSPEDVAAALRLAEERFPTGGDAAR